MVVAINLSDAAGYYEYSNEELLKEHVRKIDPKNVNVPIDFLRDTCTDVIVHPRANGKKKSVLLYLTFHTFQKSYYRSCIKVNNTHTILIDYLVFIFCNV